MGHGANYEINEHGVKAMFEEYHGLKESELYDWNSVDVRMDLEKSLSSTLLSGHERVAVGLTYGMGLNIREAGKLMKIRPTEVKKHLDNVLEIIEAVLNGCRTTYNQITKCTAQNLTEWIAGVQNGCTMAFDIPYQVNSSLLQYLVSNRDKLAKETLRQRIEGCQEIKDVWNIQGHAPYDIKNYPFHKTSTMIESPNRKRDYKDGVIDGYDYFHDQDKNKVFYDDFVKISKSLHPVGKKAVKVMDSDKFNHMDGKGLIYK